MNVAQWLQEFRELHERFKKKQLDERQKTTYEGAREQFARRLSGRGRSSDSPVLARYSLWGLAWTVLAGAFAVGLSLRYLPIMTGLAADWIVYTVMGTLWLAFFVPAVVVVGKPLLERVRGVGT